MTASQHHNIGSLRRILQLALLWIIGATLYAGASFRAAAATVTVDVAPNGALAFLPRTVTIQPGDTVKWVWHGSGHSATSGTPGAQTAMFNSGVQGDGATFTFTFPNPGTFDYFCLPHGACCGMAGEVIVADTTPPPPPSVTQPLNISTRMEVRTGDRVLIGGFIITGRDPKKVLLRAIGPSLAGAGIANPLANPVLELHGENGTTIMSNDNWKDTQQPAIEATGIPPESDLESAIVATLAPGNYTAVVSGKNNGTGVGLVEGYDLNQAADSQLANISTRGFVETDSNVMIGGFILGGQNKSADVLIRALGPSLADAEVSGALADPTLELRNENGALVRDNDNWKDTQQTAIEATGIPPSKDLESALVATLNPGAYTAIVAGKDASIGVGLVEIYRLP